MTSGTAAESSKVAANRLVWFAAAAGVALVAISIFAVNLLPVVTNDSLTYLDQSRDLMSGGVVEGGYRQVGYPVVLWLDRVVAGILGAEPLLFSVLVQRLLLVGAIVYSLVLWRWKSLPVMLLILTPEFVVYPDFVLTEGLTVPLSLLLACLVSHYFLLDDGATIFRRPERLEIPQIAIFVALTAVVVVLIMIRFPLAVFGLIPVAIAWQAVVKRTSASKKILVVTSGFVAVASMFALAAAIENSREFKVFSPTTNGVRAEYWGAWRLTFGLHPENQDKAILASYFDGGTPHPFLARVTDANPLYEDQDAEIDAAIVDLLVLSGTSRTRERVFSILGSLRGGRHNDLDVYAESVLGSDARSIDESINRNSLAIARGTQAFADEYNDGVLPQAVVTSAIFPTYPSPGVQSLFAYLLPVTWIGLMVLTLKKRRYTMGLIFIVPPLTMALAMGWLLVDNTRLLMTTSVFAVAGLSGLLEARNLPRSPGKSAGAHEV
ncbi:MAG TPA: hypothetical protein VIW94_05330 [Acidimicrobiia bacterium]